MFASYSEKGLGCQKAFSCRIVSVDHNTSTYKYYLTSVLFFLVAFDWDFKQATYT